MLRVLCFVLATVPAFEKASGYAQTRGQFNGGTISFSVRNDSNGKLVADLDMISGWVLGIGPCGPVCSKADLGRSTLTSRRNMVARTGDPLYFGHWTAEYKAHGNTATKSLNSEIYSNMTDTLVAMSSMAKWEQERMQATVLLEPTNANYYEDIYFEGNYWHHLNMQGSSAKPWHMQANIDKRIRSDTGKPNQSPIVLMKPLYRIKLGTVWKIQISAIDPDGDHVKCKVAAHVEGGAILHRGSKIPGLSVYENCTVTIDTSNARFGYHDDSWGALAIMVADYNKELITMGRETLNPYSVSLSKAPVQFLVQVLMNIDAPVFVTPTAESNHHFILYSGTVWRQKIYAKASANTTIDEFIVIGRQQENLSVSQIQDTLETGVRFIEISWIPKSHEVGHHIFCTRVLDNTGADSNDDRCFTVEIRADEFNHSSTQSMVRPYFVDLPASGETVNCLTDTTCVLPLYVRSTEPITTITLTESYINIATFGMISKMVRHGEVAFKSDISIQDSVHGIKEICLVAHTITGQSSEETCIKFEVNPPDPCASGPCVNNGLCKRSVRDKNAYVCQCFNDNYSGKHCEHHRKHCEKTTCGHGKCYDIPPDTFFCYCAGTGFSGSKCGIKNDTCTPDPCNSKGICDPSGSTVCKCYDRYAGHGCSTDNCPSAPANQLTCSSPSCSHTRCHGHGVCITGGHCVCSMGYKNSDTCNIATGSATVSGKIIGTRFVTPSPGPASDIRCFVNMPNYKQNETSLPCLFSMFVVTSERDIPTITIDSVPQELKNSSVGTLSEVQYIRGLTGLYTADVTVEGGTIAGNGYICLRVQAGFSEDRLCLKITYTESPLDSPDSFESHQKSAIHKFVNPTPNSDSKFVAYVNQTRNLILHTNVVANTCHTVVAADQEVFVFPPQTVGDSCITEVAYTFSTEGEKRICFKTSPTSSSQTRCFYVNIYASESDKCKANTCQNGGVCFHANRTSIYCECKDGYLGDQCEIGECDWKDNHCDSNAFCHTNGHASKCICPLEMKGPLCRNRTSSLVHVVGFTDTAKPVRLSCFLNRKCAFQLGVSTKDSRHSTRVVFGFVSSGVQTEVIHVDSSQTGSALATVSFIPLEVGMKTVCVQTYARTRVNEENDDEICFEANVIKDYSLIYGFDDKPRFTFPSLPDNAVVRCPVLEPCHILLNVTPGQGHDKECMNVYFTTTPFEFGHVFSSCSNCVNGNGSNNCSVDISVTPDSTDENKTQTLCVAVELSETHQKGEERCFNVTIQSKAEYNVHYPCRPNPCIHGTCSAVNSYAHCTCDPGYVGEQCDHKPFDCHTDKCINGVCQRFVFSSHCVCYQGYYGQRCEFRGVNP